MSLSRVHPSLCWGGGAGLFVCSGIVTEPPNTVTFIFSLHRSFKYCHTHIVYILRQSRVFYSLELSGGTNYSGLLKDFGWLLGT